MARPSDPDRLASMVHAAQLHFEENKTKSEVAGILRKSITEVSRLLDDARHAGYVKITIEPPLELGLRLKLMDRWDLKNATVVIGPDVYSIQRKLVAEAAAKDLEARLSRGGVRRMAVGGGETMWEVASAVRSIEAEVEIVPTALIGRSGEIVHADPSSVITHLHEKGRKVKASVATLLPCKEPPYADIGKARDEQEMWLRDRRKIEDVYSMMLDADVVYAGVGLVPTEEEEKKNTSGDTVTPTMHFYKEFGITLDHLREAGAVGDVNYSFFDHKGDPLPDLDVFKSLTITILRDMVKRKKDVVLVAAQKVRAIRAVLLGGLCSHLITDQQTASKLCERS